MSAWKWHDEPATEDSSVDEIYKNKLSNEVSAGMIKKRGYNKKRFRTCDKKAVRQADIENLVIKAVCDLLHDRELLDFIVDNTWQYYLAQDNSQEELRNLQRQLEQTELSIRNLIRAIEAGILSEETKIRMDELTTQKLELKAAIADRQLARGYHLQRSHIAYYLTSLRDADSSDREVQKRLIQTFVNSVFVYDDCIKLTFNYSSDSNTVTLQMLEAAEGGEVFGRCASCSTKRNGSFRQKTAVLFLTSCRKRHSTPPQG